MTKRTVIFDTETYRDYFLASFLDTESHHVIEIEAHPDQALDVDALKANLRGCTLVGFNSANFDLPVIAVALATGSVRATQSTFIIFFPLLFLTPSALPRELMTGWFKTAVSLNPMTYVVEAARSFLFGFQANVVLKGFLAAALFSALTFALTALAFRRRVRMG